MRCALNTKIKKKIFSVENETIQLQKAWIVSRKISPKDALLRGTG